MNLENKDK
jgi:hypothetical protein